MPYHLSNHNDEPAAQDLLGRKNLLHEIAQTVSESSAPHVFGIHGDWGSGKTSFLSQLREYFEENGALTPDVKKRRTAGQQTYGHLTVVWFEAWRFQHEATPIVALLHEIRSHFAALTKSGEAFKKLGEVGIRGLLRTFAELSATISGGGLKFGNLAEKVQSEGERWEGDHLAVVLPTAKIRYYLEQAIRQLLGGNPGDGDDKKRLVIIVDDLDRCEGEAIIRFLEGIKIYLNISNCIFVLGINQREIERAVSRYILGAQQDSDYTDAHRARASGYLDKICTFVWKLPVLTKAQKVDYAVELFKSSGLPINLRKRFSAVIDDFDFLPANPRKIKAFVNTVLHLIRARFSEQRARGDLEVMNLNEVPAVCMVSLFHLFHPTVLRYLQTYSDYFEELRRSAIAGFDNINEDVRPLLATHKYSVDEGGAPIIPPSATFIDPADNRFCRAQRLIVEGGLTDAILRPFFGLISIPN